eukprot:Pgem_evm1s6968
MNSFRLKSLIQQACAYQIEFCRYQQKINHRIESIIDDFEPLVIPNTCKFNLTGHSENVKCVDFVGEEGRYLVSGS